MRAKNIRVPALAFLVFFGCSLERGTDQYDDLIRQLGNPDGKNATEAVERLVMAGRPALDAVFSEISRHTADQPFVGLCGRVPEHWGGFDDYPLPEGALDDEGRFHPEELAPETAAFLFSSVLDAELFVAVSVGRGVPSQDLFRNCRMVSNGKPVDAMTVISELEEVFYSTKNPGENYTRETVDMALKRLEIDGV
jgi:hypothetical protein